MVPDNTIAAIASYATRIEYGDLPPSVVDRCKRHIIDALGCAFGAVGSAPVSVARKIAMRVHCATGARLLGEEHRSSTELAAFANGVMIRFLDGSDTYPGGGGGHPSDTLGALLTVAEEAGCGGRELILATALAYEVYHALFDAARIRDKGWDHVFYTAVGGAAGVSRLLALGPERTANAVALAVTPNLALEITRRGELSMWKGCAGANAARNAVFAAQLAAAGMTGPARAVEGAHGLWNALGRFSLGPLARAGGDFRLLRANLKYFLAEYHSQAPIEAALALHAQVRPEEIERVTIYTYWFTWSEIGSEPEKWNPTTRETADHSVPYIVAAVLVHGRFGDDLFSEAMLRDSRVRALIAKVKVEEDPAYTRAYPERNPCRLEILTAKGERRVHAVDYPKGHVHNPMSDGELEGKFRDLCSRALTKEQAEVLLETLWNLEQLDDVGAVYDCSLMRH